MIQVDELKNDRGKRESCVHKITISATLTQVIWVYSHVKNELVWKLNLMIRA